MISKGQTLKRKLPFRSIEIRIIDFACNMRNLISGWNYIFKKWWIKRKIQKRAVKRPPVSIDYEEPSPNVRDGARPEEHMVIKINLFSFSEIEFLFNYKKSSLVVMRTGTFCSSIKLAGMAITKFMWC